ncbi:MAG: glycosyl hydrolase family 79 N-terminal domain-containing protein [Candidatus Saccharimonadales bacterium]
MNTIKHIQSCIVGTVAMLGIAGCSKTATSGRPHLSLTPATMSRIGTVGQRFQSYNIEMLEVTGGDFWKPYSKTENAVPKPAQANSNIPAGMNPDMYEYRRPIDLTNLRRRKLAAALGPAYVRVSGTWANTTYFQDSNGPARKKPPAGFNGVLTRQQWKGVIDFANAVNAKVVTSFATSVGTRNDAGKWTPKEARKVLAYTKSIGGTISAAEFMNEPTIASMGGAPKGYDAADYGRDLDVFRSFIKKTAPSITILGPGWVGVGGALVMPPWKSLNSEDLMKAAGPVFDVFSYHFYGTVSKRCAKMGAH